MEKSSGTEQADVEVTSGQEVIEEGGIKLGNSADIEDMKRLGQTQQLSRNLSGLSVLGLTIVLSGTWFTWLTTLYFVFANGGRGAASWTYLVDWGFSITTVLSLAEVASMYPVAGGQYNWVSIFAPSACQKFLSYITGWLGVLGWQTFTASAAYATGNLILILASTMHPSYIPKAWHASLMTLLIAIIASLFNIFAAKRLGFFEGLMLLCFFAGLFAVVIPLWVLAPKASSKEVWTEFGTYIGWQPIGLACVIGQISAGGSMIGIDAAVHMAEEVPNASRVIPRVMLWAIIIGPAMGYVMAQTVNYSIQDVVKQVAYSTAVYPFISIFEYGVGSRAGAVGMTVPIVILSFAATVNSLAAASREFWSFTRNGGFPFSEFLSKISHIGGVPVPVRAVIFTNWFVIFSILLNLGGTEVYDAIISLCEGAVCGSYVITTGSLIYCRLTRGLPTKPKFSLGPAGLVLNVIAFLYNIQLVLFSYFPLFYPVKASTMNYGPVVFVGVLIVAFAYYLLLARKKYRPPVLDLRNW